MAKFPEILWFEKIFVTPRLHKIHHCRNPEYLNKNFAGTFIILDKIFGTFCAPDPSIIPVIGINDSQRSFDPIISNFGPFFRYAGYKKIPSFFMEKSKLLKSQNKSEVLLHFAMVVAIAMGSGLIVGPHYGGINLADRIALSGILLLQMSLIAFEFQNDLSYLGIWMRRGSVIFILLFFQVGFLVHPQMKLVLIALLALDIFLNPLKKRIFSYE
jgi:sterol desaturase/sphingolipid hydroxylase (fatty acid hydroxylase superfamily)